MSENTKTQTQLNLSQNRYLIINSAMLDPIIAHQVQAEDDLVLRQLEEGIFSIVKDGKQIVKYLNKLTNEHGYSIVLYSNLKEHQITLEEFNNACKRKELKEFPKIAAMVVKDRKTFKRRQNGDHGGDE